MVQASKVGQLFEHVLNDMFRSQYLSMAAACGIVRVAYTEHCSSLAIADLQTARFFLWMLSKLAEDPSSGDIDPGNLARLYASSDVNLMQFIPLVLSASPLHSIC